jgi:hypothetical protein
MKRPSPLAALAIFTISIFPAIPATVRFSNIDALTGILPQKTEHYEIVDPVVVLPPYYKFSITTKHGAYEIQSIKNLLKTCHEIRVMEEYAKTDEGNQTWAGAKNSFKSIGSGAKMLVKDPNAARKAIGRSLSKTARSIGRLFRKSTKKAKERKSSEGRNRDIGAGGQVYAKTARQFAHRMQLDVYTDNPYAKTLMSAVAEQQGAGRAAVGVATFLLSPIPGLRTITRGSLTSDAIDSQTEILIADNTPEELRYQLRKRFIADWKMSELWNKTEIAEFDVFLANGNFNPRHEAYLARYLTEMKGLEGTREAINQLGAVTTETDADFIAAQYELLFAIHRKKAKLTKLQPLGSIIGGVDEKGNLLIATPFDLIGDSSYLSEFAAEIKSTGSSNPLILMIGKPNGNLDGLRTEGSLLQDPDLTK